MALSISYTIWSSQVKLNMTSSPQLSSYVEFADSLAIGFTWMSTFAKKTCFSS